jgi:hypothetical protein
MKYIIILSILILSSFIGAYMTNAEQTQQPIQWTDYDWGKLGIAHIANAPFPDESRKEGFKTESETIPYTGHYDDNAVAIAIPKHFNPGNKIQFIVLFHGHLNQVDLFMLDSDLAKVVCESGCNAILVAPEVAKNVADSGGGKMEKPGGFARMMYELMANLKQDKQIPGKAQIGKIIVGGFSGGYRPTAFVLHCGKMNDHIQEVWLLDAAYDFLDYLSEPFVSPKSKKTLRAIFTDHLAMEHLQIMNNLSKRRVHYAVVVDEELATLKTTKADFDKIQYHAPGVNPGQDELSLILRYNRIVIIHTGLPHDMLAFSHRFIADFIRESPTLKKTK